MNKTSKPLYFDYAAATPLDPLVLAAMEPYFIDKFFNPSATYLAAKEIKRDIALARAKVAEHLGAKPSEIIFTAGGTEANNLAIHGIMQSFPKGNLVVSAMEHESVLMPARMYDNRVVKLHPDGRVDLDDLIKKIDERTVLVSVMQVNNEIGTIQPIREIAQVIDRKRRGRAGLSLPLYFHTDATQAANYLDLHVSRLKVDLMTLNGGKIYGPKQSGALFFSSSVRLKALIEGGGQERNLRSGTENIAGIMGFSAALDIAQRTRQEEAERLRGLQREFLELLAKKIPVARLNGSIKYRLPNNIHLTIPGKDNERLLFELDEEGVQAAAGSACSASSLTPSHVLQAIGLSDEEARSSLRFTMGRQTNSLDLKRLADILAYMA